MPSKAATAKKTVLVDQPVTTGDEFLTPVQKLSKDLKAAALTMTNQEARYLVDMYYQMQDNRIRAAGQVRSMGAEPHMTLAFFEDQAEYLESQVKRGLDVYSTSTQTGRWSREVCGIGPVLAAGLMAHIDITKCPTAGAIWRFAGLDSTVQWLSKDKTEAYVKAILADRTLDLELVRYVAQEMGRNEESLIRIATTNHKTQETVDLTAKSLMAAVGRRPWNASLKTLCWKIGESFVKVKGNENDVYGKLYESRKVYEQRINVQGGYREQAERILASKNYRGDTIAKKAYEAGRLPDGHIHARAKRYAVKLFLSHWHHVAYREHFQKDPPAPFAIAILGHAHKIEVPNYPR